MRLLHVIPSVARRDGGPSQAAIGLGRALAARGVDVLTATTDADGSSHLRVALSVETTYQGIRTLFFRCDGSVSYKFSTDLASWLDTSVASFDTVLISSVFSHSSVAAARACSRAGVPWILRPLGHLDPWSMTRRGWLKRLFIGTIGRRLIEEAAALYFTTREEASLARRCVSFQKGFCLPLGVDDDLFEPSESALSWMEGPYILFLSRLDPKKNVEALLHAFWKASMFASFPEGTLLVVAGDGEASYVGQLRERAAELGIENRIIWPGWLEGSTKAAAFRRAMLFVLPSRQENFGIAVAEAMAAGCPVVVTSAVNLADDIEQTASGWVVEAEESLADAIHGALSDEARRKQRGVNARRLAAARFRWSDVARSLVLELSDIAAAQQHEGSLPWQRWSP